MENEDEDDRILTEQKDGTFKDQDGIVWTKQGDGAYLRDAEEALWHAQTYSDPDGAYITHYESIPE